MQVFTSLCVVTWQPLSSSFEAAVTPADVCGNGSGLKINAKTRKGTNALHFAAKKGHVDLVRYLIRRRGNVSAKDRNGKTAMDLASDESVKAILQEALDGPKQEEVEGSKALRFIQMHCMQSGYYHRIGNKCCLTHCGHYRLLDYPRDRQKELNMRKMQRHLHQKMVLQSRALYR